MVDYVEEQANDMTYFSWSPPSDRTNVLHYTLIICDNCGDHTSQVGLFVIPVVASPPMLILFVIIKMITQYRWELFGNDSYGHIYQVVHYITFIVGQHLACSTVENEIGIVVILYWNMKLNLYFFQGPVKFIQISGESTSYQIPTHSRNQYGLTVTTDEDQSSCLQQKWLCVYDSQRGRIKNCAL